MEVKAGYKQSEVGVIPEEWEIRRLEELSSMIASGKSKDKSEIGPYPLYGSTGIIGSLPHFDYAGRKILVARVGANAGAVNLVEGEYSVSDNTLIINHTKEINWLFLYYYLVNYGLNRLVFGTGQPLITGGQLKKLSIFLPPLPEQDAIAAALSDVDALISALDKLITKKRHIKQATMQQLLTGKMRLPGFEGVWEVKALGEIGTFKKGRNIPKNQLVTEGEPCILYGEIYTKYDCVVRELMSYIPQEVAMQSTSIQSGDILFTGSGETVEEIGKCFAYIGTQIAYAGGDLIILSPNEDDSIFLGYQLNSPSICKQKARLGQGSSVVHIYVSGLRTIKVAIPPLPEQEAIAAILSDMDAEIAALEARRDKTCVLKQGMMQELLTGKTRLV